MAGGNRVSGRTVTSKVLAILAAFEASHYPLNLAEIAHRSELPASTAHRLIRELTDWGLLERTTSGRYQTGIRLWELAQTAGRQLREAARPWLQDLSAVTNQSAVLSVRQGRDSLVVERAHGNHQAARTSKVGARLPLHTSAAGKVLLAHEAEWLRRAYLADPLHRFIDGALIDSAEFEQELLEAIQEGYAQSVQEVRLGASSIAVPVFHTGRIAAVVSIVTEAARASQLKQYLPALRSTASSIESATRHVTREALLGATSGIVPDESDEVAAGRRTAGE